MALITLENLQIEASEITENLIFAGIQGGKSCDYDYYCYSYCDEYEHEKEKEECGEKKEKKDKSEYGCYD